MKHKWLLVSACAWILWSMAEVKSNPNLPAWTRLRTWWSGNQMVWQPGESFDTLSECIERTKNIISSFKEAWSPALDKAPTPPGFVPTDKRYTLFCYPSDFDPREKTVK
jgi:hypothetical protein